MYNKLIVEYYKNIYLKKLEEYNNACINSSGFNSLNSMLSDIDIAKKKYESYLGEPKKLIKK